MTQFSRFGFVPETLLLTSKGYEQIGSLFEQEVFIWDGEKFEDATVVKVAQNQPIVRVTTKNCLEIECTADQKFYVQPGLMPTKIDVHEAQDLEEDMKLPRIPLCPITAGGEKIFPHAYTHGFYTGMERYYRDRLKVSRASIYGRRRPILEHLELDKTHTSKTTLAFVESLPDNFKIPLDASYSNTTKLEWLAGLFDGGLMKRKTKPVPVWQLYSDNVDFLYQVKLLLQTLGVDSTHTKNRDVKTKHYSLSIRGKALELIRDQGLPTITTKFENIHIKPNGPNGTRTNRILSVEDAYRTSDVYNFVTTTQKSAILNGMYIATN
jgi:ribonucleoside-diphosphate reductase alpha chain